jgi:DNA-binding GntR family transcriptional regulator
LCRYNCGMAYGTMDVPGDRLVDWVAELLRDRIIEGRYAQDEPLPRRRLGAELNIGTTAVGEALRVLVREGLVLPGRRGEMRVARHDRALLLDAYELRGVIDGLSARLTAQRRVPVDRYLENALQDQHAAGDAGDSGRFMRADIAFHAALLNGAGNLLLLAQLPLVRWTCRNAPVGAQWMRQAIAEHEDIRAAVRDGDPEEAERAAKAHIRARAYAADDGSAPLAG